MSNIASGALSMYSRIIAAGVPVVHTVKAAPGAVYSVTASSNGAACYIKWYNTRLVVSVGVSTPVGTTFIPAGGLVNTNFDGLGVSFTEEIEFAVTALIGPTDATGVPAGEVLVNVAYA